MSETQQKRGRGGRGGQQQRPQTAAQKPQKQFDNEEGQAPRNNNNKRGRGRDDTQRGGGQRNRDHRNEDKDSWFYKFHHDKRPTYEKIVVEADTELPKLPTKEEMLKAPSKEQFDEQISKLDAQIAKLRDEKQACHDKRREILDGGKMQGSSMTFREALTGKISELKTINKEKQHLQGQINAINGDLDGLESEKKNILRSLKPDAQTEDQIKQALNSLNFKMQNTQFKSSTEEGKIIKEIQALQDSLPFAKKLTTIKPRVAELKKQRDEIYAQLKEVKKTIAGRDTSIEALRKKMEEAKEGQTDTKMKADAATSDIDAVVKKINEAFAAKDKLRDDFWHAKWDFEVQRDYIHYVNGLNSQQNRLIKREEILKEEEHLREQQIKDLPHPFAKEIENCQQLIHKLTQLKIQAGLEQDSELAARELHQKMLQEQNQQKLNSKLNDGKIQMCQTKEEREQAATMQIGGGKKQKGKKQKQNNAQQWEAELFQLDIITIQKFGSLNISPPTKPDDLQRCQDLIREKLQWFEENGETERKKQVEELIKKQKEQAERERAELLRQQEEESKDDYNVRPRGGRGRGRGGRGARETREPREERPRQQVYKAKNEFEDEEEDPAYAPPTRQKQQDKKTVKQAKEDLTVNEDNYPTL